MRRNLLLACFTLAAAGCDALTVHPFAGSVLVMTVQQDPGVGPTPSGHHLELWARDRFDDILRIAPFYDSAAYKSSFGLSVRQAISLDDPCMIDGQGHLLVDADAYPTTITEGGITQTPEQQAQQIRNRVAQLTAAPSGSQASSLLALVPWDPTPAPVIAADATADERLAACRAYWAASDLTYTPNPLQITSPAHGYVFGYLAYVTVTPPTDFDGIRLDAPVDLTGLRELFLTDEADQVDPAHRGPVYLHSKQTPGGDGVIHFDLSGPNASGTATVISGLAGGGQ